MRKTTTNNLADAAEKAVTVFETLEAGKPWQAQAAVAEASIAELHETTRRHLFTDAVVPVGADLRSDLELYVEDWAPTGYAERLAQLHGAALTDHPALAAFLRGSAVRSRLASAAASLAGVFNRPAAEMILELRDAFERSVAGQLHARGELEPHAELLAVTAPALNARLVAEREKREAADAAAEAAPREALAERVEDHPHEVLRIGTQQYDCADLARTIRAGAMTAELMADVEAALDQWVAA